MIKSIFCKEKYFFHFEKQCCVKVHHCKSLPCDLLKMHLLFPVLPVDSLGQSILLSGVQPLLIGNLTSSSFRQDTGKSRVESTKYVQNIIIIITTPPPPPPRRQKTKPTKKKPNPNCTKTNNH